MTEQTQIIEVKSNTDLINKLLLQSGTGYKLDYVINQLQSNITVERGVQLSENDYIEIIRTAIKAGLDPLSKQIYGFKNAKQFCLGITKAGWDFIRDSRKASMKYEYGDYYMRDYSSIDRNGQHIVKQKECYKWVKCILTLQDGQVIESGRISDCEFNKGTGVWAQMPQYMLQLRAYTTACRTAFGIGAYEITEAREVFESNRQQVQEVQEINDPTAEVQKVTVAQDQVTINQETTTSKGAERVLKKIKKEETNNIETTINSCTNINQLQEIFKKLSKEEQQKYKQFFTNKKNELLKGE